MSPSSSWLRLPDDNGHDNDDNAAMPAAIEELRNPRQAKDDFLKYMKEEVFKLNFYRAHMLYFIVVIAISSAIVYGQGVADGPEEFSGAHMKYIDALFLCCSAMTTTGMLFSRKFG